MPHLPDRRTDVLDRRAARPGGRRLTDIRPDVAHGVPCDTCDAGIAALVGADATDRGLRLTYRCPLCGQLRQLLDRVLPPSPDRSPLQP
ncbi:MAG: hypothetical protein AB7N65_27660 [Vicinamibacterales bacterium]